jgi:hypothetical protein
MKRGQTHSAETVARIAEKARARMTSAERAKIAADTRARMADPAVRQRIRDGMAAAKNELASLSALRAAWNAASPSVRKRFIEDITLTACFASVSQPGDGVA